LWAWDGAAIGRRVQEEREKLGWSQRALAERAGVSHAYVSHLEAGQYKRPSREKLELVFGALRVPLERIVGEEDPGRAERDGAQADEFGELDPEARANLLSMRELTREERRIVWATIHAMVDELKKRRGEREDVGQDQRPTQEP
jgi:transcriptional regulator with XRE-family HTH domain